MTTITWKGDGSADVNEWYGIRFEAGKPVEITQDMMPGGWSAEKLIAKARTNRFYEVIEGAKQANPPTWQATLQDTTSIAKAAATIPADTAWSEREQAYLPEKKGMPMPVKRRGRPRKVVS